MNLKKSESWVTWKSLEGGKEKERNNVVIFSNNKKYIKRREGNL